MHCFARALLLVMTMNTSPGQPPPPTSLLDGRVTFELPSNWEVHLTADGRDDGVAQLRVPRKDPKSAADVATGSLTARRVAADVTVQQAGARVATAKASKDRGDWVTGDVADGDHWRTVVWSEHEHPHSVLMGRFGVDAGVMVELVLLLPFGKDEQDPTWLNQVVKDFNSTVGRLKIDGKTASVTRVGFDWSIFIDEGGDSGGQ